MNANTNILKGLARNWATVFLLFMGVVFSFLTGTAFLSVTNIQNIFHLAVTSFLLAAAQTFVIITGGIDLSIGFIMGLTSVLAAVIMQGLIAAGLPTVWVVIIACLVALAVSLLPGLVNGIIITRFQVPPFIATLGMWGITAGIALKLSEGMPVGGLPDILTQIGNSYLIYIHPGHGFTFFAKPEGLPDSQIRDLIRLVPMSFLFLAVVLTVLGFLLARMKFGRHTYAIGGSVDAAVRSGIPVDKHLIRVYMLSSLLAGLAGIFNIFQTGIGNYTTFNAMYELFAVAAVVIGGASLMGGKGKLLGSMVGVLVLAVLENGLAISGVEPFYRYIAVGVLLIVAVVIDGVFPDLF